MSSIKKHKIWFNLFFRSLQIMNLSFNLIKKLPKNFGELNQLKSLNLSGK